MKSILIIQFSLNLLSLLSDPATGTQSVSQNVGGSVSFYCYSSTVPTIKKCSKRECCWGCQTKNVVKMNLFKNYWLITFAVYYGDSGWYFCWNDNTWVEAFYLKVQQGNIQFVMFGEIGGSIVMSCPKKYQSRTWCRKSQDHPCKKLALHESDKRIRIVEELYTTDLEIQQLRPEDSGNYSCLINEWDKEKDIDLQVFQGQNDFSVPLAVNVMPGQPAKITCKYNYKYINENKTWECFISTTNQQCLGNSEQVDDRSRSELVLSINHLSMYDNGNIYRCKVSRLDGTLSSDPVKLMVGLTTQQYVVTHIPGETARIRCNTYHIHSSKKSWCKVDFEGTCSKLVSSLDLGRVGKFTLKDKQSYFEVTIQNLTVSDSGLYRCVYQYWSSQPVTADVTLSVKEQQVSPAVTRKPTTKYRTMTSKTTMKQEGSNKNNSHGLSPVLLGIICLLFIISITLLIMLLKKYRKSSGGEISDRAHNFGEGTFHMNEHRHNNHPININNNYFTHSQEIHAADAEDSSSTSSESSDHSFEDIPFDLHPENPKLIVNHMKTDYQNIKEEVSAADDYENMPRDKDQDYVNVTEPKNVPEDPEDTESQALRPTGNRKDSITSSESNESSTSDESDELSVNYSLVVFKKATE